MNVGLLNSYTNWIHFHFPFSSQMSNERAEGNHMRAVRYRSWRAAQTAAMAQEQRIYCSTEDRAHWQPVEQYNYWSTKREPGNQRVQVCVCSDNRGIDHWFSPSPCAASWPDQLRVGFSSLTCDCLITAQTCKASNLICALGSWRSNL